MKEKYKIDKIKVYRKCGKKWDYHYRAICPSCSLDRGYLPHSKSAFSLCKSCAGKISHKNPSEETRQKMSNAKKGKASWNSGLVGVYSEETRKKMGERNVGKVAHNKNKPMSEEQKIKLSCTNRNISIDEFDDFTTEENKRERNKFSESGIREECFKSADYTCQICKTRGIILNAHHIKSWKDYPEERFNLDNLQCLCEDCHNKIHNK